MLALRTPISPKIAIQVHVWTVDYQARVFFGTSLAKGSLLATAKMPRFSDTSLGKSLFRIEPIENILALTETRLGIH